MSGKRSKKPQCREAWFHGDTPFKETYSFKQQQQQEQQQQQQPPPSPLAKTSRHNLPTPTPRLRRLCDVVHLRTFSWKFRCPHPVARRLARLRRARGKRGKTRRKNSADIFFLVLPSCLRFAWKRCLRKKGPKKKERTQNGGALIVVNTACRKIRKNQLQQI